MVLKGKTILITGGSSGIGLELAKQLVRKRNKVIICGRSSGKLKKAKEETPSLITCSFDISTLSSCQKLATYISENYPETSILINNAAVVHQTSFKQDPEMVEKAISEIATNLVAPVLLSKLLLPVLEKNENPAIINITTGLIYAPKAAYPIYNATKSGLNAFTETLRMQFKELPVRVLEVQFPVVDTPWHNGNVPRNAISAKAAAAEMVGDVERGKTVVKVGKVKLLYWLSRISPAIASRIINRM